MKTKPSVGDRVYFYSLEGTRICFTVLSLTGDFVETDCKYPHLKIMNYRCISGRLVKKPRKCEECAKPKKLLYIGHDGDINNHTSLHYPTKKVLSPHWKYISTLALISTEEVKE